MPQGDSVLHGSGEYHSLSDIRAATEQRFARERQPLLFDRLDWMEKLHAHCLASEPLAVMCARTENSEEAWLFLTEKPDKSLGALANWYSFRFRPIFFGQPAESVQRKLVKTMATHLKDRTAHVHFYPVVDEANMLDILQSAFQSAGWHAVARPFGTGHFLEVAGQSFDSYWADRPGSLRSTVKRKGKAFPLAIDIYDHFTESLWDEYESVYRRSWKQHEPNPGFLRDIGQQEGFSRTLRLGIARHEGMAMAAQFWTVENGIALIHKLAHDKGAEQASPGTLLSHAMFRHVIDVDKVSFIDFGTGGDAYKADWMSGERPLYRLDFFNLRHPAIWYSALRSTISALVPPDKRR